MKYATTIKTQPGYWHDIEANNLTAAKREATRELSGSMYDGDMLLLARQPSPGQYIPVSRRTMRGPWYDDPAEM